MTDTIAISKKIDRDRVRAVARERVGRGQLAQYRWAAVRAPPDDDRSGNVVASFALDRALDGSRAAHSALDPSATRRCYVLVPKYLRHARPCTRPARHRPARRRVHSRMEIDLSRVADRLQ